MNVLSLLLSSSHSEQRYLHSLGTDSPTPSFSPSPEHYRQSLQSHNRRACTCTSPLPLLFVLREVVWHIAQLTGYQAWICHTSETGRQAFTAAVEVRGSSPREAGHPERIDNTGLVFLLLCKQPNRLKLCNPILPNWQLFQGSFVNWEHDMYWSCFFIMHLALTGEAVERLRHQQLSNKAFRLQFWLSN